MKLVSPYVLPYRVMYHREVASAECDITVRISLAGAASAESARALDATVLPFLLLATSGALAGESIPPWNSTVESWADPIVVGSTIEWRLTSVTCDPQAWVMLAQMLLVDHEKHAIERIEIVEARRSAEMFDVVTGMPRVNPYPTRWAGISFPVEFYGDFSKNITVYAAFARPLMTNDKEGITEEFFAWAPGLVNGAYGVAPVPPDRCTGLPDREIVFVDNELEWPIHNFKAHTAALEGLVNVLASVSQKIVPVTAVRVE